MKKILFILLVLLSMTGCDLKAILQEPSVVKVYPQDKSMGVPEDAKIKILFSDKMDEAKTNMAFSLVASKAGKVSGFFKWDNTGKEMTFIPQDRLVKEDTYTITITREAEDSEGNDLQKSHTSTFSPGKDREPPKLKDHTPKSDTIGNSPQSPIVLTFSEPMDLNSIYRGITISPAREGYFSWNETMDEITFQPLYEFSYGVTYKVTLSPALKDINGVAFEETESFNFTVGEDFTPPLITKVYQETSPQLDLDENSLTEGCEKDSNLFLEFSERVKAETIASSISFSPSKEFYVTTSIISECSVARINFPENLESETTYTMNISTSIMDMENNKLARQYRFRFKTNGPNSLCPTVSTIGDSLTETWTMGEVKPLAMENSTYNGITVKFSQPIDPLSLKISTTTLAGTGFSLRVVNINWNSERDVLTFGIDGISSGNIYKIKIHGGDLGLKDLNENRMKEDFIQLISF